jgi:hypothetical protein
LTMLKVTPSEVVTDAAPIYPAVLEELMPAACCPSASSTVPMKPDGGVGRAR